MAKRGNKKTLTHLDGQGGVRMVDVTEKPSTARFAVARAFVRLEPATVLLIRRKAFGKGDVASVAKIAGILGAKRVAELVPLAHPISLSHVSIDVDIQSRGVSIRSEARTVGPTGPDLEALGGAALAALTVYDMVKSADREAVIEKVFLEEKSGGRSGHFVRKRS